MDSVTKINKLLNKTPAGTVLLSSWLVKQGYPYELQQRYRKSGWLKSIGHGAMIRSGQKLLLNSAIYTLQSQAGMNIHIGGRTALGMQGYAHNIEISRKETLLFAPPGTKLPAWLWKNTWDTSPVLIHTSFLNPEIGLTRVEEGVFLPSISNAARAMMECLYLIPDGFDLTESGSLMEGLTLLRPGTVQVLLEQCKSVKVKRLFLFFAENAGHAWFKYLQLKKISLGSGTRSFVENGVFIPKYKIMIPGSLL